MNIIVNRFTESKTCTIGNLIINENPYAMTLEDVYRDGFKIKHKTAIPPGKYEIKLREVSGMAARYNAKYDWHQGMLELRGVPNYTYVYIHPGIHEDHSSGCILVSDGLSIHGSSYRLKGGIEAYKAISLLCYECFDNREPVFITVNHIKYKLPPY